MAFFDPLSELRADPISRDDVVVVPASGEPSVALGPWVTSVAWESTDSTTATVTVSCAEQRLGELVDVFASFWKVDEQGVQRIQKWNTLTLLGTVYVLREVDYTASGVDLVFYDAISERLKTFRHAGKVSRGSSTRAEFVGSFARQAGIAYYSPAADLPVPVHALAPVDLRALHHVSPTPDQATQLSRHDARNAGLAALRKAANSGQVKINTIKPTLQQLRNVVIALSVADQFNVKPRVRMAMLMAGIAEGQFFTTRANFQTGDATGPWQILHSTAANLHIDITDVAKGAEAFLVGVPVGGRRLTFSGAVGGAAELARKNPHMSAGEIAATIEGGGETPGFYSKWTSEVLNILDAWSGPGGGSTVFSPLIGSSDRAYVERYEFTTSRQENYWEAAARLGGEVRWRRYAVFNALAFVSDRTLADTTPFEIRLSDDWLDSPVTWKATAMQRIDEMQGTGRLASLIPAGTAIHVVDDGPTSGTWLVRRFFRSDMLDELCPVEFSLGRPQAPLAEPASTVKVVPGTAPAQIDRADKGRYRMLVSDSLTFAGPDQGLDFTGTGKIYAPVDVTITRIAKPNSSDTTSWPGGHLIAAKIESGHPPMVAGQRAAGARTRYGYLYFAEALVPVPGLKVGDRISAGSLIATLASSYPGCELGFAQDAHGTAYGSPHDGKPGGPAPIHGRAMGDWMRLLAAGMG